MPPHPSSKTGLFPTSGFGSFGGTSAVGGAFGRPSAFGGDSAFPTSFGAKPAPQAAKLGAFGAGVTGAAAASSAAQTAFVRGAHAPSSISTPVAFNTSVQQPAFGASPVASQSPFGLAPNKLAAIGAVDAVSQQTNVFGTKTSAFGSAPSALAPASPSSLAPAGPSPNVFGFGPAPSAFGPAPSALAPGRPAPNAFAAAPPTPPAPLSISGVAVATAPEPSELAARRQQEVLFTPAVRRDIYSILLNPADPGAEHAAPPPQPSVAGRIPFRAALAAKSSKDLSETKGALTAVGPPPPKPDLRSLDTFAFIDRPAGEEPPLPSGWTVLSDDALLSALDHLGEAAPLPLAALKAFEQYLAHKAATCWGEAQAARLSVDFLIAFGCELTPRLDVHHRIRSGPLRDEELAALTSPPLCRFVDQAMLARFQAAPRTGAAQMLQITAPSAP